MKNVEISALLVDLVILIQGDPASAAGEPGTERGRSIRTAELNQLGILEYCQAQGLVEKAVVAAQRATIQRLSGPLALDPAASPEELAGRAGFLGSANIRADLWNQRWRKG